MNILHSVVQSVKCDYNSVWHFVELIAKTLIYDKSLFFKEAYCKMFSLMCISPVWTKQEHIS